MNFSITRDILALTSPKAILAASKGFWSDVIASLNARGSGVRESGCFLLGTEYANVRFVTHPVYYDDLDPDCMRNGGIDLRTAAFGRVWDICREKSLSVLADVHTHPGRAIQSDIDERHPAISTPGHVAIILPSFARKTRTHEGIGLYVYEGAHRWRTIPSPEIPRAFALRSWL